MRYLPGVAVAHDERVLATWLLPFVLAGCGGCAQSHVRGDGGAGEAAVADAAVPPMDAPMIDAPVHRRDAGAPRPDGALPDGTDCSEVTGYRRCGIEDCPYLCPGSPPVRCDTRTTLCLPRPTDSCRYDVGDPDYIEQCMDAAPCLVPGDWPTEDPTYGRCLDLEDIDLCLVDPSELGLPAFHCVWTDMTHITRSPPPATCPAPADARVPFCAGACGEVDCGDAGDSTHFCIGLSDTRGFGACASALPCWQEQPVSVDGFMDRMSRSYGEPVACMVLKPQPPEAPFPRGNITLAATCLAYEAAYPEGVECRDQEWRRIFP